MPAPMAFKAVPFTAKPLNATKKMKGRAMTGMLW